MNNTRILILGYGQSGKDTAAAMLEKITRIPYAGSCSWASKEYMAKKLGAHPQLAWAYRHQNRKIWKRELSELRKSDQNILLRKAVESVNEDKSSGIRAGWRGIVAGARDRIELFS